MESAGKGSETTTDSPIIAGACNPTVRSARLPRVHLAHSPQRSLAVLGTFPYIACWSIIYGFFIDVLNDVDALYGDRVDDFVPVWITTALSTTSISFSSFTVVQWVYQYAKPKFYWHTEVVYAILSLTSKVLLGSLLLFNVLRLSSADEGGTGA